MLTSIVPFGTLSNGREIAPSEYGVQPGPLPPNISRPLAETIVSFEAELTVAEVSSGLLDKLLEGWRSRTRVHDCGHQAATRLSRDDPSPA